ncbi:MAG: hypothetical protein PHO79_09560 [Desulfoplanes sp.]|nr:hypothetical protein [Desulfoplanes sp.]
MVNPCHLLVRMFPTDYGDEASQREQFKLAYEDTFCEKKDEL